MRAARGKGKACNLVVSPFMMCSLEMAALTERQVPELKVLSDQDGQD